MSKYNENIELFKCYVRVSHFTKNEIDNNTFHKAYAFAIQSVAYLMTVDWYRNPYSDEASDYKCGHILIADDGYLLCQPNNRIYWKDSNWVTKEFPIEPKSIKVDTHFVTITI